MKKVVLIAAVAGMAMVSCKKKYTCECTTTVKTYSNGQTSTVGPNTSSNELDEKMKKSDAKDKCESSNGTTAVGNTSNGIETTVVCSLKD